VPYLEYAYVPPDIQKFFDYVKEEQCVTTDERSREKRRDDERLREEHHDDKRLHEEKADA
jgi:hypothetical protein